VLHKPSNTSPFFRLLRRSFSGFFCPVDSLALESAGLFCFRIMLRILESVELRKTAQVQSFGGGKGQKIAFLHGKLHGSGGKAARIGEFWRFFSTE